MFLGSKAMQATQNFLKEKLVGQWAVYNVTAIFNDQDDTAINKILQSLESGAKNIKELCEINKYQVNSPTIYVEILPSGEMVMTMLQSMLPNAPITMQITLPLIWNLNSDKLSTQPLLEKIKGKANINDNVQLTADQKDVLNQQIPEIETNMLADMKNNPQMSRLNTVRLLYSSGQYFLDKSEEGDLELHKRI